MLSLSDQTLVKYVEQSESALRDCCPFDAFVLLGIRFGLGK